MVAANINFLLAIGVALSVIQAAPIIDNSNNKATCTTPQCHITATTILDDIDPTADPCQDFSQFTCNVYIATGGGFNVKNEIPTDGKAISPFDILNASNKATLRLILDPTLGKAPKPAPGDVADRNNLKKIQDLFASCMNETGILMAGRKPLTDEIQKIISAFPASDARADKTVIAKALVQIAHMGLSSSGLVSLYVGPDSDNPLINVLNLNEDGLGLGSSEDYQDQERIDLYRNTIGAMFQIVFGEEDVGNRTQPLTPADVKQEWSDAAKDVVDFEIQLAAIATPFDNLGDPTKANNPFTIEQVAAMTPSIDWSFYIQEALPTGIKNTRPIVIYSPEYFHKLEVILQKTTAKTLQRYFSWIVIQTLANHLADPYNQPLDHLFRNEAGITPGSKPDRWKTCVSNVNKNMGQLAGHYFVQATFKGNSRKEVMNIVDNILDSYGKNFPTLAWLDKTTRDGAIKKLKAITRLVGYSTNKPDVLSSSSLDAHYKDFTVAADEYFGNQLRFSIWSTKNSFSKLPLPVDKTSMSIIPQTVNAFYSPQTNTINFPAGILQLPFFHVDSPEYVNYGSMGVIGGHEIGHAFDNNGRVYDSIGRVANWWTNATSQAFEDKAQCFVNQYGNFTIKGPDGKDHSLDGQMTLAENLADNGGAKMAFRIWQNRVKSDPYGRKYKNFKLPGLEKYTPEQLFFISYGRIWCNKMRPEALVHLVRTNTHSPAKWRINGVAQNSPDFAKAFNCPAGSPMNPPTKCEVW